jgi:hypothetical protein
MSVKGGPAGGQPGEEEGKGTGGWIGSKASMMNPAKSYRKGGGGRELTEYTGGPNLLGVHCAIYGIITTQCKWRTCVDATQLSLISIAVWKYKRDKNMDCQKCHPNFPLSHFSGLRDWSRPLQSAKTVLEAGASYGELGSGLWTWNSPELGGYQLARKLLPAPCLNQPRLSKGMLYRYFQKL